MILTIDHLDGHGAIDYSAAVSADSPFTIERTLNAPSRCTGALVIASSANPGSAPALRLPVRRARVVVSSVSGMPLFTGYIATNPESIYAGAGLAGPVYRVAFTALSDEWLLDKLSLSLTLTNSGYAAMGGTLLAQLANRTGGSLLTTSGVVIDKPAGVFTPEPAKPWSANAGLIAGGTYAAYRALGGALSSQTVGATIHTLDFDTGAGGALQFSALKTASVKEVANDVTVVGLEEPSAYVQELFSGDGTTTVFQLSEDPFRISKPTLLADGFNLPAFNTQLWTSSDPGSHFSLGAGGLTLSGGNGFDGQTVFSAIDRFEIGGTLILEAAAVRLDTPSDGVLLGLYPGPVQRSNCFAGYNVRQSGGSTLLTPFINGAEAGTSFTVLPGHSYTLRLRIHSPEVQRVLQTSVVVRKADIVDGHSLPETLTYKIAFANDWAEALGIQLSESIPADTYLPTSATAVPGFALANLQQLAVISATPTALTLDAGIDPPTGGGFEVRRRDFEFGPGPGADLVLRSPVRGFTIPRAAQLEHYFVRMYDGSAPPNYSQLSAAIFTNLPLS